MNQIIDVINSSKTFIITSHVAPDGDNVGSSLALTWFLRAMGKESYYVLNDSFPQNLAFLYGNEKILESSELSKQILSSEYTLIALDCGDINRLAIGKDIINTASSLINIDHHQSNNRFGDYNYVVTDASSTSELVYNLVSKIDSNLISPKIAQALYTGLVTDTGRFQYDNASISAFLMAADLLSKGADKQEVTRNIYQSDSYDYVRLSAETVSTLEKEGIFSFMILETKMLEKYGVSYEDTEDLVNYTVNLDGVELGILFKERGPKQVKVSFRSKQFINVNEIASKFDGGGHMRAAGCTINNSLQEAVAMVLNYIREYIKEHGWNH